MPLLLAFNGYLTIIGLVMSGVGGIVQIFSPEIGQPVQETGLITAGIGGARKGVKVYKGMP